MKRRRIPSALVAAALLAGCPGGDPEAPAPPDREASAPDAPNPWAGLQAGDALVYELRQGGEVRTVRYEVREVGEGVVRYSSSDQVEPPVEEVRVADAARDRASSEEVRDELAEGWEEVTVAGRSWRALVLVDGASRVWVTPELPDFMRAAGWALLRSVEDGEVRVELAGVQMGGS